MPNIAFRQRIGVGAHLVLLTKKESKQKKERKEVRKKESKKESPFLQVRQARFKFKFKIYSVIPACWGF